MTYEREPVLQPVSIESLRPTQITVGMREVEENANACDSRNRRRSARSSAIT
jgi:hypothetical protein